MIIGIDARLINETGVGRYIRNLIQELSIIDNVNSYVVFLKKSAYEQFKLPNKRWRKVCADIAWHTVEEQIYMPRIFYRAQLDLLHVPYFNVPLLYLKPYVVTIHDLTILHINTGKASKLPFFIYQCKRYAYYFLLLLGLSRAKKIITVSHETKRELMNHFAMNDDQVVITYEGVDKAISQNTSVLLSKTETSTNPYFLYVGNAYPHKNLYSLVNAFTRFKESDTSHAMLYIVGSKDDFTQRLKAYVNKKNISDFVRFIHEVDDVRLASLYSQARAYIFLSHMEGFGLPGIEAMSYGVPLICSDIPVFHEIYKNGALYVEHDSSEKIADLMKRCMQRQNDIRILVQRAKEIASTYTWNVTAKLTLYVYEHA